MKRYEVLVVLTLLCACEWDKAFVSAPAKAVEDAHPAVREASAVAVEQIGPNADKAILAAEQAVRDPEWQVRRRAALDLVGVTLTAKAALPDLTSDRPPLGFDQLVDEYLDAFFRHHPTAATEAGVHRYDGLLEDYSPAAIAAETAVLQKFAVRFAGLDPRALSPGAAADRELVNNRILAQLLELERIRAWEKDPDVYLREINYGVFLLLSRNFAPAAERLGLVVAREQKLPEVLLTARRNLKNPPRIFTELALEKLPGIIGYFRHDVPEAFREVSDAKLQAEFQVANQAVLAALSEFQRFLQDELLGRSQGDYRLGAEHLRLQLLYADMLDIPLDRLLQIGTADLRANQQRFQQTAAKIDAQRTPTEVLAEMTRNHPTPDKLLEEVRNGLEDLRHFITTREILTLPSLALPLVRETPPYKRTGSWASVNAPGPLETTAKETYYFVTLADPSWPAPRVEEHLQSFSRPALVNLSIHEAYPGHYTQFQWIQRAPSKVRQLFTCDSNVEGWAHYAEQMLLDEGYGHSDPQLRLAQLHDALLRNARTIVAIELHTGRTTYAEAIEFFVREGYQTRTAATLEVQRGTRGPGYLLYTLGKLAILKLREDYRKLRGDKFSLREFHDEFLKQGAPPIKLIRRVMLGDDGPVL